MAPTSQDDVATKISALDGKVTQLDGTISDYKTLVRFILGLTITIVFGILGMGGFALSEIYKANKSLLVIGENTRSIFY